MVGGILGGLAVLIALGALGYARKCASLAARGAPNALVEAFTALGERVDAVETESTSVRANMVSWVAEITGVLESVESCMAQIETKRRRTASAAARIDAGNGTGEVDPGQLDRFALMQLARDRGLMGD